MKIPRAIFRYVEHELYNYEQSKCHLQELREDILAKAERPVKLAKVAVTTNKKMGKDVTSETGIELVTNSALVRLSRRILEIEEALQQLTPHHRQLFKLKYCDGKHRLEVCHEMYIEQNAYYKYRRELVLIVATKMALL